MARHEANSLCKVHRRPATKRDNTVTAGLFVHRSDFRHLLFGWVRLGSGEHFVRTADIFCDFVQQTDLFNARVSDYKSLCDIKTGHGLAKLCDGAMIENARCYEIDDRHYVSLP